MNAKRRNSGNTLFIVIILLLLASMMSLFAMNVGVFEQKASGSDLRAKLVNEVAEAGLAQGMEYLRQNSPVLKDLTGGNWEKCDATTTDFPCGSIVEESTVRVFDEDGVATDVVVDSLNFTQTTEGAIRMTLEGHPSADANMTRTLTRVIWPRSAPVTP